MANQAWSLPAGCAVGSGAGVLAIGGAPCYSGPASSLVSPSQMGACFSKVFNGCPLKINSAVTWIHPETRGRAPCRLECLRRSSLPPTMSVLTPSPTGCSIRGWGQDADSPPTFNSPMHWFSFTLCPPVSPPPLLHPPAFVIAELIWGLDFRPLQSLGTSSELPAIGLKRGMWVGGEQAHCWLLSGCWESAPHPPNLTLAGLVSDQYLVVGAEEGIYTLNLHELHEDTMEKVRCLEIGV